MGIARAVLEFLSAPERKEILAASFRILDEVGVRVRSRRVLDLLARHGARTDEAQERAWLAEPLVRAALAEGPRSVLLAAQDPAFDLRLPTDEGPRVATGGEGVELWDLETLRTRPSLALDLVRFARLADALAPVDFFWPVLTAHELGPSLKSVGEIALALRWTRKHVQHEALSAEDARAEVGLASALAGGAEDLRERPLFSVVQCPISPLEFERGLIEATVELARAGIPIVAMSASMTGLTSPVTLAGTLAQVTAENLAELTICQAAQPGAPVVFSSDSSAADLRTGGIDYGAPESLLLRAGLGQIGRELHLPVMVTGAGLERLATAGASLGDLARWMSLELLPTSDLSAGLGGLDSARGAALEQLVIDADVLSVARRLTRGFLTNAEALALETIREVGPGGLFVATMHTLDHFKQELSSTWPNSGRLPPGAFDRGAESLIRAAKGTVRELLAAHEPPVLEEAAIATLTEALRAAGGSRNLLSEPCGREDPYAS